MKKIYKKILKYLKEPYRFLLLIDRKSIFHLSDKTYLSYRYKSIFNKKLDLKDPKTFNEKLQWLKLYDRKDIYTTMVDKYEAKKYVANIIGEQYIIPTLGVYNNFDEIDFEKLPNKFVIKCTHDSGSVVVVKDKSILNVNDTKFKINEALKKNFYYCSREWPYKNVKPRIIIEKYMESRENENIKDYKFFCFSGNPVIMYISEGLENHSTARMSFYDMNFELTDCKRKDFKTLNYTPKKPKNFEKMKKFACILSQNIPHLRVDFYEINGKLYFGELTFYTNSGFIPFENETWNKSLGELIKLPPK